MGKSLFEPHFRLHEWIAEELEYFAGQLGFRKAGGSVLMIAGSVDSDSDSNNAGKNLDALNQTQRQTELRFELCSRLFRSELSDRFHGNSDSRSCGPGTDRCEDSVMSFRTELH